MKTKLPTFLVAFLILTQILLIHLPPVLGANEFSPVFKTQIGNVRKETGEIFDFFTPPQNALHSPFLKCDDSLLAFSPQAAPCNGVSVTSISFSNANRTVFSGTNNTVGVVYKYSNVGTAPDGSVLDALVTVVSYTNNHDNDQSTFRDADTTAVGFDGNLQPSLEQESNVFTSNTAWSGSITYKIQFVATGTTTPRTISVAATTIDNDGSGACGGLHESVTYSNALNQTLTSSSTNQTRSGNTFTGPAVVQSGIGTGIDYANAALFVNVSELSWTYSFATTGACSNGGASEDRYGSLNMSCQINFNKTFALTSVGGNVFNDVNGLTDNTVNGTGTNAGGLFANLIDANGNVVASATVAASGTYSFPSVVAGTYEIQISTNQGVESSPKPASASPNGWVHTGENLGTAAGSDGTVNGLLPVTVGTTAVTNANFGIEQRPVAATNNATSQTNPGGTTSVTVPASTFSATDTAPGTVSSIRITAFPSNATSITINGTIYTSANFPAGGVTVPTNASGNPSQPILVDPIDGAVTVGIPYVAVDNAGVSSAAASANVPFVTATLSGTVFNDTNGLTDSIVNGTGTNAGGLFANLLDASNNVTASVSVQANGTYTFSGLNAGNYTVQISKNQGTAGSAAPATALPDGWVNTGENLGTAAGNDGTANGLLAVTVGGAVSNANFGIEQPPTASNNTATNQTNPGDTNNATVPATIFTGTDTAPGTVTKIKITAFPSNATSITINGTSYTSANFPAGGVSVPTNSSGNPTQTILVDPLDGAVTVGIPYSTIDDAGVASSGATASVPFVMVSMSGNVFNDTNGLTDSTVNGTGTNAGGLFANLLDSNNKVVATATVAANGVYSFPGLYGGAYIVQISVNQGTVGNAAPAMALPNGWVSTGENVGTAAGNDGAVNALLSASVGSNATNLTNVNFGIEQAPTANNNTIASQNNPGGTISVTVPPTIFTATDVSPGTVANIRITGFPTNATSITINNVTYTSNNFPQNGVLVPANTSGNPTQVISVDPLDGSLTVGIPFVAVDNAGVASLTNATANVPFSLAPTAAMGGISGKLTANGTPIKGALVVLVDTASDAKTIVRTDANGEYAFTDKQVGKDYVVHPLSSKFAFNPGATIVNLQADVDNLNFNGVAKKYRAKNDFDGDGKSDIVVWRASDRNWYVQQSSDDKMIVFNFGLETDVPVAADYDGDGRTDYAVFRPSEGNWYIWQSESQKMRVENFGLADDGLVQADYDGDGKADVAVFRNGTWYIRRSSDNAFEAKQFGSPGDKPIAEDFDGDGRVELGVYRPTESVWYIENKANGGFSAEKFGLETDVPIAGDFDGDGAADIAQFRNGSWFVLNSTTRFESSRFGTNEDKAVVGDYDGDGRADTAVFRRGIWYIRNSGDGTMKSISFGLPTDVLIK